mmetsp:Transcript_4634/g.11780  ORF Transcript_4634/g.11780 Transcript_4634/m.11780 type:complete len:425 (-) Transcript_4634:1958-3232(-)
MTRPPPTKPYHLPRQSQHQIFAAAAVMIVATSVIAATILVEAMAVADAFSLSFGGRPSIRCRGFINIERHSIVGNTLLPSNRRIKELGDRRRSLSSGKLFAKKDRSGSGDENADGSGSGAGMDDAFRQLEELASLGGLDDSDGEYDEKRKQRKDEAFARAMKELNLQDIIKEEEKKDGVQPSTSSLESEVELYKDMAEELSVAESEEDIVLDLKEDILSATTSSASDQAEMTNKLMDKAIDEALVEAREQVADKESVALDKESFLDNEEIMSEIEKIFDKANAQLLEGLEEIRTEQMSMARESAERNALQTQARIDEEEQRLAAAEENMKKMLSRVNEETKNVETAIEDLKQAQVESDQGIDGQLSGLKSGGLIKQVTLVGSLLFTFRAGIETVGFLAGDVSHALPALVQGAIAIVCILGFILL